MISIAACCHGAKLCAHAARDIRSQQQHCAVAQPPCQKFSIRKYVMSAGNCECIACTQILLTRDIAIRDACRKLRKTVRKHQGDGGSKHQDNSVGP